MAIAFLSGIKQNSYVQIINKLHNAFIMGRGEYTKDLAHAYNRAINWKVETSSMVVPYNVGVYLLTEDRGQDGDVHASYVSFIMARDRKQVECHICGMN